MNKKTSNLLKIGVAIIVVGVLIYVFRFSPIAERLSIDAIQSFVQGFGMWGPVIYILLYAGLTVAFFPASIMTIAGGLAYGKFLGTVYAIIGATIAATLAFFIARYLARGWVERNAGKTFQKYNAKLEKNGFETVAILRLLFLPYIPLSYAAGASQVGFLSFVLATFITNIPGGFAFAYLGSSLGDWRSLLIAVVMILIVMAIPKVTRTLLEKRSKKF